MIAQSPQHVAALQTEHRRLRKIVAQVNRLCRQPTGDAEFYPHFLQMLMKALGASAGAVWLPRSNGGLVLKWHQTSKLLNRKTNENVFRNHQSIIRRTAGSDFALRFTHELAAEVDPSYEIIAVAIGGRNSTLAVIELMLPSDRHASAREPELAFLNKMANLARKRPQRATTNTQTEQLQSTGNADRSLRRLSAFAATVHQSLDLETSGYVVANEMRNMLGCDRVSLAVVAGGSARLLAISGQDTIDRRADVVRQLESLARLGMHLETAFWCQRNETQRLQQIGKLLHEAGVDSPWKRLGIVPLKRPTDGDVIAVAIIEQIDADVDRENLLQRLELIAPHAAGAIANACNHQLIFLLPLWRALGQWVHVGHSRWRTRLIWAVALLAIAMFLGLFPVSMRVHGRGTLQPATQRDVFADIDGVVAEVYVQHGDRVQAGDPLVKLHNSDLELQIADLLGRRRAVQEHLAAIGRRRHEERLSRETTDRLTGQMLHLQEQLRGLDQQHELLLAKQQQLVIRSTIAGRVTTWDVHRQLMLRPVAAGQVLLTIADETGPWQLEVHFPESEITHLRAAEGDNGASLPVEYLVVSEPAKTHCGALGHIDDHAQLYEDHGHAVRAVVNMDRNDVPEAPAGTTVRARIDCGQKSIGYVWLHRLAGFVYTRVLFRIG